jgi:hypothetical protein
LLPSGKIVASDRQTGLYVLKTNFPLTGVSGNSVNSVPENFSLGQNYPNPFNPSTVISYQLPKGEFVDLKIYNQLGKEVSSLVNKNQNAGKYEVTFDGTNLSSGIYFYSIKAGKFSETKKMIMVK